VAFSSRISTVPTSPALLRVLATAVLTCAACTSPPPEPQPGCNPLVGDDCRTPFPSSFYEIPDVTSATGVREHLPDDFLQVSGATPLSAQRLNLRDGASPGSPFIVYFQDGVDASQLPGPDDLAPTVGADSPIVVLDMVTGARLPVWAELDALAGTGQRQALLIHPAVRLATDSHYAIALVGLRDAKGKTLAPAPFRALRDGAPLNDALTAMKPRMDEVFAALEAAGVARGKLTLAWDVHTGSDEDQTRHLVGMRDTALPLVPTLGWTVTTQTDFTVAEDPNRLREVTGTFTVPWFLSGSGPADPLQLDATGTPVQNGLGTANFVIEIPRCAETATAPLPVLYFGHGLFGDAHDELDTAYERYMNQYLCMVQIATDWIGLAAADLTTLPDAIGTDLNQLTIITDRIQQAHVNAQVLTRLFATRMKDDPAFAVGGQPVTDGKQLYYFGISDGGIQGGTYMALSEDVQRGVLNVPGGEWDLLIFRSTDFNIIHPLLSIVLPDAMDQQLLIALLQPEFDFSDPINFAPHLLHDPLAGSVAKDILVQEGIADAQVTNLSTRVLVRTMGLTGLDLEQSVYDVSTAAAPLPSAYTQWDVSPSPLPPASDTALMNDNQTHEGVRRLPAVEAQIKAFLAPGGVVTDQCAMKPCVYPSAPTTP
jgi:hypothetical protein